MMLNETFIVWGLIALLGVIQMLLVALLVNQQRKVKQLSSQLTSLAKEHKALVSGSNGLGRKLYKFRHDLNHLEQSQVQLQSTQSSDKAIEQAAAMMKSGVDLNDIISSCSISRGEAELLQEMLNLRASYS
ncbi:MAG: DUF2802 domain-containing protein [Gammaproteobacteria bacterium]|nr:DUF2802 domain-containing protein [Gammaproteobacteria bacterium]NVK87795.1 DUF2802 domain-containing protein [Gammaproteobacteria bacterium]